MLELVKVSEKYISEIIKAAEEYKTDESPYRVADVNGMIEAANQNNISAWIKKKQDEDRGINLKPGYVSSTYYLLMEDEDYIGSFNLRHRLTEKLMNVGGHVAYIILPSKRRKGYASVGLGLCLKKAKKMGIERVLITCDVQNIASFGVIMKAMNKYGGEMLPDVEIENGFEHRVWVNTIG